jgi:hypothetical protein
MATGFFILTTVAMLVVFAIDTAHKRRDYLSRK